MPMVVCAKGKSGRRAKYASGKPSGDNMVYLQLEEGGHDMWKLDEIVDLLERGGVGIIPTDTLYAFVCDVDNRDAVDRLYNVKRLDLKKPLSLLCPSFRDIETFTTGIPNYTLPGRPAVFPLVKQSLPGPYTFILPATKRLPKQLIDRETGMTAKRKQVGVRMPDDPVTQAVLERFGRPLLCSSVRMPTWEDADPTWILDAAQMSDIFSHQLDFIVDDGRRSAEGSTVVDLTGKAPAVLRRGKGQWELFDSEEEPAVSPLFSYDEDYDVLAMAM